MLYYPLHNLKTKNQSVFKEKKVHKVLFLSKGTEDIFNAETCCSYSIQTTVAKVKLWKQD